MPRVPGIPRPTHPGPQGRCSRPRPADRQQESREGPGDPSRACSLPQGPLDERSRRRARAAIHATAERVVRAASRRRIDVSTVDLDGRRSEELQPGRFLLIAHLDLPNGRIESERFDDVANQLPRRWKVWTAIEIENVDP